MTSVTAFQLKLELFIYKVDKRMPPKNICWVDFPFQRSQLGQIVGSTNLLCQMCTCTMSLSHFGPVTFICKTDSCVCLVLDQLDPLGMLSRKPGVSVYPPALCSTSL